MLHGVYYLKDRTPGQRYGNAPCATQGICRIVAERAYRFIRSNATFSIHTAKGLLLERQANQAKGMVADHASKLGALRLVQGCRTKHQNQTKPNQTKRKQGCGSGSSGCSEKTAYELTSDATCLGTRERETNGGRGVCVCVYRVRVWWGRTLV